MEKLLQTAISGFLKLLSSYFTARRQLAKRKLFKGTLDFA
jgi:hypothetical protein